MLYLLYALAIVLIVVAIVDAKTVPITEQDEERRFPIPRPTLQKLVEETDFARTDAVASECTIGTKCKLSDRASCSNCGLDGKFVCTRLDQDVYEVDGRTGARLSAHPWLVKSSDHDLDEGYCLPEAVTSCNTWTGEKVLAQLGSSGVWTLLCKCKYPSLVDQNGLLSDCDIVEACKPLGKLKRSKDALDFDPFLHGVCECPNGYESRRSPVRGPECVSLTQDELPECYPGFLSGDTCQCPDGYVVSSNSEAYESDTAARFFPKRRCLKEPCVWDARDASQNTPYRENVYVKNYGCVCDYSRGHVGIHTDNKLLNARGYSACTRVAVPAPSAEHKMSVHFYNPSDDGTVTRHYYPPAALESWVYNQTVDKTKPFVVLEYGRVTGKYSYLGKILRDQNFRYTYRGEQTDRGKPGMPYMYRGMGYVGEKKVVLARCQDIDQLDFHHKLCYCGQSMTDMKLNFRDERQGRFFDDHYESVIAYPPAIKRTGISSLDVTYSGGGDGSIMITDGKDPVFANTEYPSLATCREYRQ